MARIWLTVGGTHDVCLFDTDTGDHRRFVGRTYTGATAGTIVRFGKAWVAAYAVDEPIVVQVGRTTLAPGDGVRARLGSALGGLRTVLTLEQDGTRVAVLKRWGRRGDAAFLADLVNSARARENFRGAVQPDGGPNVCWAVRGA